MEVQIDGDEVEKALDVHSQLGRQLDFGPYYGSNLAALWDRLSADVERPVHIRWLNSSRSRLVLGPEFDALVAVIARAADDDVEHGLVDRLTFELE